MKKTQLLVNNAVYLGISILELNKIVMYEVWYSYAKPKYKEKAKYIKTEEICTLIAKDVEANSTYEFDTPLPKGKNKKVIDSMKDELEGKIMK